MLPFSREEFVQVFATYNAAIWPAQVLAYALALVMLVALPVRAPRLVLAGLALMWLWTGVGYHWLHFTRINKAAWIFGGLFVLQGILLLVASTTGKVNFTIGRGIRGALGWGLIGYATVVYPVLGLWSGHAYPGMPTFGVTPCPVTIFTFGLLLLSRPGVPCFLLVVPAIWSLLGGSAAFLLQVPQDWLLLFSASALIPLAMRHRPTRTAPVE